MTKHNYPKQIRIGHMDYNINFVPQGMRDTIDGRHNSFTRSIDVADDTKGQYRAFVLLHEILHGCFFNSALSAAGLDGKEEIIVDAISKSLCSVLRDNPLFIKELLKDLER